MQLPKKFPKLGQWLSTKFYHLGFGFWVGEYDEEAVAFKGDLFHDLVSFVSIKNKLKIFLLFFSKWSVKQHRSKEIGFMNILELLIDS